jgi:uncharacterized protein YuzE
VRSRFRDGFWATCPMPLPDTNGVHVTCDAETDAAYIAHGQGRHRHPSELGVPDPWRNARWGDHGRKDGRLVGVEILGASDLLHDDLLAAAERIDE